MLNNSMFISLFTMLIIGSCNSQNNEPSDFLPKEFVIYQTLYADLNNDNQDDCILIIKGTNKEHVVINRFEKEVDRNRRGIIVLFKKEGSYHLIDKNQDCFYSENEDGGVYYAPQLDIETEKGNIILNYEHGRYGYWNYRFRFLNSNYKLIDYNHVSSYGPVTNSETIINFLTKKKIIRKNTNEEAEGNDEVFKETRTSISIDKLIELSEIKYFEELDLSIY